MGCARADPLPTIELDVAGHKVEVEVADDDAERQHGLMGRKSLPADHGMLFVFPDSAERRFWMKDTPLPLSIAYIDAGGRIVHLADMQPFDTTPVPSGYPAMYALEMAQGWFARHQVAVGDKITGLPKPSEN